MADRVISYSFVGRFAGWSIAMVLPLLLLGCGGEDSLAQRDPNGYEACSLLAESLKATDATMKLSKSMDAGTAAMKASTGPIQASATALFDEEAMESLKGTSSAGQNFALTDVKALTAACEDENFSMPDAAN